MNENANVQELITQSLVIAKRIEQKASMFSKSMLVLSILDVIFGVLAIFCTSLQAIAFFASASSMTAIVVFGRVIQVSKIRQLSKSLKPLNLVFITWFVNKFKKLLKEKVKMTKSTLLQKILIIIMAVFGAGGIVVYFFPQFTSISAEISNIIAMISEAIGVGTGLCLAGTSDKVLSAEEIEAEKKAKEDKKKAKSLEKAQALVAEYENAKAIVAEHENSQK